MNIVAKTCKPLNDKLTALFGLRRPYDRTPPDLTGRKRVYCSDCKKRWIMVEPEMIKFHTIRHPFRCMQCRKIRLKQLETVGVRVYCSGDCGSYMIFLPCEIKIIGNTFTCLKCQLGI